MVKGEVDVYLHPFSISVIGTGQWSYSHSENFVKYKILQKYVQWEPSYFMFNPYPANAENMASS
jgi:hypothetical protein